MPDVKEVFEMVTQKSKPEPGALERQHSRQRFRRRRQRIGALAVAAAIVAGFVAFVLLDKPAKDGQPATSPQEQLNTTPPIGTQIVSLDGKAIMPIPGIPAASYSSDLSPDGTKVAFVTVIDGGAAQIATIGVDGSGYSVLTHVPLLASYPRWSPDGTKIAYASMSRSLNRDIYVMDADGSHTVRLTTSPAFDDTPAWSPDGTTIAYQSGSADSNLDYSVADEEIWTVSVGGGTPVRLTHDGVSQELPSWSPNGRWIAMGDGGGLAVMNADGSHIRLMKHLPGHSGRYQPRWSPDGRKLAFLYCCRDMAYYPAANSGVGAVQQAYALRIFVVDMVGSENGLPRDTGATTVGDTSGVSWNSSSTALLVDRWS